MARLTAHDVANVIATQKTFSFFKVTRTKHPDPKKPFYYGFALDRDGRTAYFQSTSRTPLHFGPYKLQDPAEPKPGDFIFGEAKAVARGTELCRWANGTDLEAASRGVAVGEFGRRLDRDELVVLAVQLNKPQLLQKDDMLLFLRLRARIT